MWGVWVSCPGDRPDTGNAVPRQPWQGWSLSAEREPGVYGEHKPALFACREGAEQEAVAIARSIFRDRYDAILVKRYVVEGRGEFRSCVPDLGSLGGWW